MRDLKKEIESKILIIDGAMGSLLQKRNLLIKGIAPEELNLRAPGEIQKIHSEYIECGADIIETNTFGGNKEKLSKFGIEDKLWEINYEGARTAKRAAENRAFVAGSIGPTGRFIKTEGDLPLKEAVDIFASQAEALEEGGVDLFIVETMFDLWELKAAVMGIKKVSDRPVITQLTYQENRRTLTGTDPETHASLMDSLNVFALGTNCSLGAKEMLPIIREIKKNTNNYVSAVPNAGIPYLEGNKTVFPMKPDEFAAYGLKLAQAGVNITGGCCGTEFEHIKALSSRLKGIKPAAPSKNKIFRVSSRTKTVRADNNNFCLIGERLNPTARKKLKIALKEGDFNIYAQGAIKQEVKGADIIDVNTGVDVGDEKELLKKAVGVVQGAVNIPLSVDSANPKSVVAALEICDGKPLINSVNAKKKTMDTIFPAMAEHGSAAIALLVGEKGIPSTLSERMKTLEKILEYASRYKIPHENLIIDCLSLAVAAEKDGPKLALETIKKINDEYKLPTLMGISNVSHGLPLRKYMNSAFLAMCMSYGLKGCIGNPLSPEFMAILRSSEYLLGLDLDGKKYIDFSEKVEFKKKGVKKTKNKNIKDDYDEKMNDNLYSAVVNGLPDEVEKRVNEKLRDDINPFNIMKKFLIPAIEMVGIKYDKQEFYLPQLISGADAVRRGFEILKPVLAGGKNKEKEEIKKKILLATVEGDIHDIGKNIVKLMLENFGFIVEDLGKDVKTDFLIKKLKEMKPDILALSALMTTTMSEMEKIVAIINKEKISVKVMIGGAVVTQDYADKIGADGFASDATGAVSEAKKLSGAIDDSNKNKK
ncbi:MAG: homocysteine S-methyltransferase family protein [Candidatus Muiribacteriota bacterium]